MSIEEQELDTKETRKRREKNQEKKNRMDIRCRMSNENDKTVYHLICSCPKLASTLYSGGKLSTRLYDKRDDFDFHIVNFPFLSSNIPSGPSYGVYISQLIRYARCCSHYNDFRYRHKCLVDRLLSQGYKALRLEKSFKKFYGRYQDLIEKYRRSVNAMVSDSFPGQFLFNM